MIIYDLKCEKNHKFEGWFNDRKSFEEQKKKNLVVCPICGGSNIDMIPSSITTISGKEPQKSHKTKTKEISPLMALKMFHDFVDREFDDVGEKFADVAINIHRGLEERRNIKGTTTKKDEETLTEEGVEFIKIPVPKFDS